MKTTIMAGVLAASFLTSVAFAGGSSTVGPANPSAVNCINLGGQLEAVHTPLGASSNCVIEEWHLYREMDRRGLVKKRHYGAPVGMPNPAAVNCIDIKGELRMVRTRQGDAGFCVVDSWDLFKVIRWDHR